MGPVAASLCSGMIAEAIDRVARRSFIA